MSVYLVLGNKLILIVRTCLNTGTFDATMDMYTVPSDLIYEVSYCVRYGSGIQASLLRSNVKIGVLKQDLSNANKVLDERLFTGANLLVARVTFSSSEINLVYTLNAGDDIFFAIDRGGISLGFLGSSYASFVAKKIFNLFPTPTFYFFRSRLVRDFLCFEVTRYHSSIYNFPYLIS